MNAQSSTGPVTPAGKAVSSRNAITHACTTHKTVILEGEQPAYNLKRDINPLGQLQQESFETMVLSSWNQRRCRLAEVHLMAKCEKGLDPPLDPDKAKQLYAGRHDYAFHRALRTLRQMQTEAVG